ncbi:hypothetical protein, partial [Chromohalobacter sp. HP20-39]|uniref:hypothetical protein n=1 Tax=Chromohalobacter sp. HP20-39 TaxID=3079306 RepID=UPI00294AA5BF
VGDIAKCAHDKTGQEYSYIVGNDLVVMIMANPETNERISRQPESQAWQRCDQNCAKYESLDRDIGKGVTLEILIQHTRLKVLADGAG